MNRAFFVCLLALLFFWEYTKNMKEMTREMMQFLKENLTDFEPRYQLDSALGSVSN
jgi:hypothetical protein